jgi:RNA polymerase sigma factor (sigma-70 family)
MVYYLDVARLDLAALQAGDPAVWRGFLEQCDPLLHAIASWPKWQLDAHAREEVVQATRVSLAQSLPSLTCPAALPAFVRRVCALRCIDAVRRRIREQAVFTRWECAETDPLTPELAASATYDPVREILLSERATALRLALSSLDDPCQRAVRAFYVEGCSYKDMAEQQGVTINTIGSRLSRCLEKLRERLQKKN